MQNNDNNQEKKARQLDNLENLVENHTRTKRHLEQYSEIGKTEYKEMAREKQEKREENIQKLENSDKKHAPEGAYHIEKQSPHIAGTALKTHS